MPPSLIEEHPVYESSVPVISEDFSGDPAPCDVTPDQKVNEVTRPKFQAIAALPRYRVLKSVGASGDLGHFVSSEQCASDCI